MQSTHHQAAFVGGEISPWAQGRSDLPSYAISMNVCLNAVPVEEGPWTRRSGFMMIGPTRGRNYAKLLPFVGSPTCAYVMEFTSGSLRFVTQSFFNCTNDARTIASITNADPGVVTLDTNSGWTAADDIYLVFPTGYDISLQAGLRSRPLRVASPVTDTFALKDDLGVDIDTTAYPAGALIGAAVLRLTRLSTPYSGTGVLASLRAVQAEIQSVILCPTVKPYVATITTDPTLTTDTVFSFDAADFKDGPYLDPVLQADGTTEPATVGAYTGTVTFTDTGGNYTFVSDDIGRHIRIFTQPAAWDSGTTYSYGDLVTGPDGAWWRSLAQGPYAAENAGIPPGTIPPLLSGVVVNLWAPALDAGRWAWGKITTITSAHVVQVALVTDLIAANGATVASWQLGLFRPKITNSDTVGFPICGTYHEGRLWLAGAAPNRVDASVSNDIFTFSPSEPSGLVADNSAIARTFDLPDLNNIFWMEPDQQGLICGTLSGEVLISASNLNDPLTPTSIQAHRVTTYGCANINAKRVGMVVAFVQKHQRRVMEYLADSISGRYSAKHLNERAKHISLSGIQEIAYQEETIPIIWNRLGDGSLASVTYRRFSRFVTENPTIEGWARHSHGRAGCTIESICTIPGKDGLLDRLFASIYTPGFGRSVEVMQPFFEVEDEIEEGWFVDQCLGPGPGNSGYDCGGGNPVDPVTFPTGGGITGGDNIPGPPSLPDPGETIPAGGDPDRPRFFAIFGSAVYFDGTAAMYGFIP